jgi:hypothetical protein
MKQRAPARARAFAAAIQAGASIMDEGEASGK